MSVALQEISTKNKIKFNNFSKILDNLTFNMYNLDCLYGLMVNRLRRRPFTAE